MSALLFTGRDRLLRTASAAIWTIFLVFAMYGVWQTGQTWSRAVGTVLIVLFWIGYLAGFWFFPSDFGRRRSAPGHRRAVWALLAVLLALEGAVWAISPEACVSMLPFTVAFTLFLLPLPTTAVMLVVGAAAVTLLVLTRGGFEWVLSTSISVFIILVIGLMSRFEARTTVERERNREITAAYAERERIASGVHDLLGQSLTVMAMKAELVERLIDANPQAARDQAGELHEMSREALAQVRNLVDELRQTDLASQLAAAATALSTAEIGMTVKDERVEGSPADGVWAWVLREAVTNVIRHSQASHCWIDVSDDRLRITDDGVGLGDSVEGSGRAGMKRRVDGCGGELWIGPGPDGRGTRVIVS